MKKPLFSIIAALAISAVAGAKDFPKTATFTSETTVDAGQCTVEVMVPGTARVKIEGDSATLQQLSGRQPEWRKFECTGRMPEKPTSFRLETLGGRGKEELVHGPRHHGGSASVHISDPKKGEDVYSFNVIWGPPKK